MKTTVAALGLLAIAIAGCTVDDRASVEIAAICAPPEDATQCGQSGRCDAYLASPRPWVFTVFGLNELMLFIEFDNQMPNNADDNTNRVNTNDFIVEEYRFTYSGVGGLSDVRFPASATIFAGSASAPVVTVIPQTTMTQLTTALPLGGTGLVVAQMTALGHLLDGTTIETGPFPIAIDVINDTCGYAACQNATEVRVHCPNSCQTESTKCVAP